MAQTETGKKTEGRPSFQRALRKSAVSFLSLAPLFLGAIGLVGILQTLVSPELLSTLFHGNGVVDTLVGTIAGAAAYGNPVVSYLLGGELLKKGVSLYAVTAFILSWVTLGFVHLPVEAELFGYRFALLRNILAFVFTMIVAAMTAVTVQALT